MGYNKAIEMGRLVRDPEIKMYGEAKVANFTLAIDRDYKKQGAEQPDTDFLPVSVWGKQADFVERYFVKGLQVLVAGPIETYPREKDGVKFTGFRINAKEVRFADSRKADGLQNGDGANEAPVDNFMDAGGFQPMDTDEDLPF